MSTKNIRIVLPDGLTVEQVNELVDKGARFVVYRWVVSILVLSFREFTPAYLVYSRRESFRHSIGPTLTSLVLGWWGIPWGPIWTIGGIAKNLGGGYDVTQEILLNLTPATLEKRKIALDFDQELFNRPGPKAEAAMVKAAEASELTTAGVDLLVAGLRNYTQLDDPVYSFVLRGGNDAAELVQKFEAELRNHFKENVRFDFISYDKDDPTSQLLAQLGSPIIIASDSPEPE